MARLLDWTYSSYIGSNDAPYCDLKAGAPMFHMIISALVHGLIYSGIRETMHGLGLHGVVAYVVVGLLATAVLSFVGSKFFRRP
jgi:hypothetical protein